MRLKANVDGLRPSLLAEQFHFPINKTSKLSSRMQKRFKLELNSWSPFVARLFWQTQTDRTLGDQLLSYFPASSFLIFTSFLDGWC
jgi:hypothetical protein